MPQSVPGRSHLIEMILTLAYGGLCRAALRYQKETDGCNEMARTALKTSVTAAIVAVLVIGTSAAASAAMEIGGGVVTCDTHIQQVHISSNAFGRVNHKEG